MESTSNMPGAFPGQNTPSRVPQHSINGWCLPGYQPAAQTCRQSTTDSYQERPHQTRPARSPSPSPSSTRRPPARYHAQKPIPSALSTATSTLRAQNTNSTPPNWPSRHEMYVHSSQPGQIMSLDPSSPSTGSVDMEIDYGMLGAQLNAPALSTLEEAIRTEKHLHLHYQKRLEDLKRRIDGGGINTQQVPPTSPLKYHIMNLSASEKDGAVILSEENEEGEDSEENEKLQHSEEEEDDSEEDYYMPSPLTPEDVQVVGGEPVVLGQLFHKGWGPASRSSNKESDLDGEITGRKTKVLEEWEFVESVSES